MNTSIWMTIFGLAVVVLAVSMLLMDRRLKVLEDRLQNSGDKNSD